VCDDVFGVSWNKCYELERGYFLYEVHNANAGLWSLATVICSLSYRDLLLVVLSNLSLVTLNQVLLKCASEFPVDWRAHTGGGQLNRSK
jgi:hypothetical protein